MGVLEYHKKSNRVYSELECHAHSVYEVYYFVAGDAELMVEGRVFKLTPHSLIIFPPGVLHGIQVNSKEDYIRYCLYIEPNEIMPERKHLLTEVIPNMKLQANQELLYENTKDFNLEQFFSNLKMLESQPKEVKDAIEPIFIEALIAQINILSRTLRPSTYIRTTSKKTDEIVAYINEHLTESLSLDSIASQFYISKNYLNHMFKESLGTTVVEYIRIKRVALAKQFMKEGQTAMNAALMAGFCDYSSFYRAYTKYNNFSPREGLDVEKHPTQTNISTLQTFLSLN